MKNIILILTIISISLFSAMTYSEPKPTFENPRKWIIKMNTDDIGIVNKNINAVNNVLKDYPQESLKIVMVFYASGIRVIQKRYDAHTIKRLKSLMEYEVEMIACQNTMDTMHWSRKDLIEGLDYVQAGIAEVIERVVDGWINVTPY